MAQEPPFKDRKRAGDVTGRKPPASTSVKAAMHQGTEPKRPSPMGLRDVMGQGTTKRVTTPLKLGQVMKQK